MTVNIKSAKVPGRNGPTMLKKTPAKAPAKATGNRPARVAASPPSMEYLGGKGSTVAKMSLETEEDFVKLIRKGISKRSISHPIESTNIPANEMAAIMEIAPARFSSMKPGTMMEKSQSEKAVHIARLYTLGEQVFEGREDFEKWMNGPVPSLGKKKPRQYLDTITGINFLMDELNRIRHGVYS